MPKVSIKLDVEVRDNGEGCSFRCPHLMKNVWPMRCRVYGPLGRKLNKDFPRRTERCIEAELEQKGKVRASTGPDVFERLLDSKPLV